MNVGQAAGDEKAVHAVNHIIEDCFPNCRDNYWGGVQHIEDGADRHEIDSVPVLIADSLDVSRQAYHGAPPKYLIHE
jgi:hypothetical protein